MSISDELIRQFMNFGLSKQQATSTTTEKLVEYFMPDEGKSLILEAKRQASAMEDMVNMVNCRFFVESSQFQCGFSSSHAVDELEKANPLFHATINQSKQPKAVALLSLFRLLEVENETYTQIEKDYYEQLGEKPYCYVE